MVTKAKRIANDKWDRANMDHVGCKIKKVDAEAFRAACKAKDTTPNAVLKKAIADFMSGK